MKHVGVAVWWVGFTAVVAAALLRDGASWVLAVPVVFGVLLVVVFGWLSRLLRRRALVAAWFCAAGAELARGEMFHSTALCTGDVVRASAAVWTLEQHVAKQYAERPQAVRAMGPEEFARRLLAERDQIVARRELAAAAARAAGELYRLGVEVRRDVGEL